MNYLRGRLIKAKYIIFNRCIQLSFETYRQHFNRFADLAFDCIRVILAKIQLTFGLFLQIKDSYKVCNKWNLLYLHHNNRTLIVLRKKA